MAILFILAKWTLADHVAPQQALVVILIMMMLMIMMRIETILTTGLHLIALMGKNFPVLFSSEVMLRKGLLQVMPACIRN